jgi:hypothetical protein
MFAVPVEELLEGRGKGHCAVQRVLERRVSEWAELQHTPAAEQRALRVLLCLEVSLAEGLESAPDGGHVLQVGEAVHQLVVHGTRPRTARG